MNFPLPGNEYRVVRQWWNSRKLPKTVGRGFSAKYTSLFELFCLNLFAAGFQWVLSSTLMTDHTVAGRMYRTTRYMGECTVRSVNDVQPETPPRTFPGGYQAKCQFWTNLYCQKPVTSSRAFLNCSIIDVPHGMYRLVRQWCTVGDLARLVFGKIYQIQMHFHPISSLLFWQIFRWLYIIDGPHGRWVRI